VDAEEYRKHLLRSRIASVQNHNTANAMQTRGKSENTESSFSNPGNQLSDVQKDFHLQITITRQQ